MVQAAAHHGLDFAAANLRSRHWWLKVRWILDRIEDLNTEKVLQMQHAQHVSVLDYTLSQQTFDHHWKSSNEILQTINQLNFPWLVKVGESHKRHATDALVEQWKSIYGDPSDPKVQAHFKQVAAAMRRAREKKKSTAFSGVGESRQKVRGVMNRRRRRKK